MKRIEKIYRDQPGAEGLYDNIMLCRYPEKPCDGDCRRCTVDYLNEEVPEYDAEFIEKLKAIKLLFPWAEWLAMDFDGTIYVHSGRPKRDEAWWGETQLRKAIDSLYKYFNDWKNSLIDIDKVIEEAEQ